MSSHAEMRSRTRFPARSGLLAAAVAAALSTPAYAQDPTEEIVVTGSRIRRAGFDTLEPATVVSKEYIDLRGLTNVADALNEIPGFGVGITPEGNQASYGTGVNFANRFGLGTNRTLTLVNGRRFVASNPPTLFGPAAPGVQVDLNAVPTALVERIENLAIGGAPTYGADAIAGVVNVITRTDYEGLEFSGSYGTSEHGGSERQNASGLFGTNFGGDRGNVTVALSYDSVDGVLQKERDFFSAAYFNATNPAASTMAALFPTRTPANDGRYDPNVPFNTGPADGIPNGVLIRNRRIWSTPFGGLISPAGAPFRPGSSNLIPNGFGPGGTTVLTFDASGNLVPYNPGIPFTAVDASGGDGLDLVESSQITSDVERKTLNTTARWSITDAVDVFLEGTFYTADSAELSDQWMYNSALFGGTSGLLTFPATHPMLTTQAQTTLAGLGVTQFSLAKASRDLVVNNSSATTDITRVVAGFEGEFEAAGRQFDWEAYYNDGETDADYFSTSLIQQNFINALNVVLTPQGPACSPTPIPGLVIPGGNTPVADAACVPLDMFGDGRPSAAARNYLTEFTVSNALIEQQQFNMNLSSTIAEIWSGPVQYNVGYEHREESAAFDPDLILELGLGRSVPITPLVGEYSTNELFAEFILPLVDPSSDRLLAKQFEIIGKYRSVDSSINGGADASTYGLTWRPIEDFIVRSNVTRSIRAPAITELFLPQATSFQFVTGDPCDSRFIAGGPNPAVRQRNCQAFLSYYGLTTFSSNAAGASIQGISGGNPTLDNETADSVTYGFSWSPSEFLSGLTVTADYYKIEIEDVISNLNAEQLASGCYDNPDFNAANVPNANVFCSQIVRNAPGTADPGQATTFTSGYVNGKFFDMEAYSAEVRYQFDIGGMGQFAIAFLAYLPKELTLDNTGTSPNPDVDEVGGAPERQYHLSGIWQGGKLGVNLTAEYISGNAFNVLNTAETRDILRVASYNLVHAGASYDFNDRMRLRLAITNLLDEDPPFPAYGTASVGMYDILGRRYQLAFEWRQ
jgi:outer membrane receptor protein involved in Fe transport